MALGGGRPTGPDQLKGKLRSLAPHEGLQSLGCGITPMGSWQGQCPLLAAKPRPTCWHCRRGRPPGVPQAQEARAARWRRGLGDPFSPNPPTQDRVRKCTPPLWPALREPGKKGDFEPRKVKLMSTRLESGQNASSSRLASLPSSLKDPHCLALGIPASLLTSYVTCK